MRLPVIHPKINEVKTQVAMSPRIKAILYPLLFEFYWLSSFTLYFTRREFPENALWLVIIFIKLGLGYVVYRLLVSDKKKSKIIGFSFIVALIITTYILYYSSRDTLSPLFGSYQSVLLSANSFFIVRYWRYPDIVQIIWEYPGWHGKFNLFIFLFYTSWSIIELFTGNKSGLLQIGITLLWIGFYHSAGVLAKTKLADSDNSG